MREREREIDRERDIDREGERLIDREYRRTEKAYQSRIQNN